MSNFIIEPLPVPTTFLGESPHWDARTQKLYYIDIFGKAVHSFDPVTKQHSRVVIRKWILYIIIFCWFTPLFHSSYFKIIVFKISEEKAEGEDGVGLVIPVENAVNKFVIGFGRAFSVLEWDGRSEKAYKLKTLQVAQDDNPNGRFNDGKCDSSGRLWSVK